MHPDSSSSITTVKRRLYLLCLPLAVASALSVWLLERAAGVLHAIDRVGIPLLAWGFLLCWVLLRRNRLSVAMLERLIFGGFSAFMLASLSGSLFLVQGRVGDLAGSGYWFPVTYCMAFLIFGPKQGRLFSGALYLCSVALGLIYLAVKGAAVLGEELLIFSQIYAANLLVLIFVSSIATISRKQAQHALEMQAFAYTDGLTNLPNRRRLEEMIQQEMERALRYNTHFALILFDLDHFKTINDRFGHDAGDLVLRDVGQIVSRHIRQVDSLGRWGGEEFTVILPELKRQDAVQLAERLRTVIAQTSFATLPAGTVTASFGVTPFRKDDTLSTLYKRADSALYQAKQHGRNCWVYNDIAV
jgi:diguanylate cyclase (GGDEF)-like protein